MQFSEHTFVCSEMYQQLEGFCQIISYLKSLVAADCEEDQEVYHPAAQNLLLIFWECDLFNYQWCVSFFLESVKRLSQHYLEVYEKFMAGDFLVQKSPVISNAAFLDIYRPIKNYSEVTKECWKHKRTSSQAIIKCTSMTGKFYKRILF